jgi:hypothetical protein
MDGFHDSWTVAKPAAAVTFPGTAGASFTGVTVIDTIAAALSACPSFNLKLKLSVPDASAAGV